MSDPTRQAMRRIMLGEAHRRPRRSRDAEPVPRDWQAAILQDADAYVASIPEMFRANEIARRMSELATKTAMHAGNAEWAYQHPGAGAQDANSEFEAARRYATLLGRLYLAANRAGGTQEMFDQDEPRNSIGSAEKAIHRISDGGKRRWVRQPLSPLIRRFPHMR